MNSDSSTTLTLSFLPLELGVFSAKICFYDPNVGEFFYEVSAKAEAPAPQGEGMSMVVKADGGDGGRRELGLALRNPALDKALAWLTQRKKEVPVYFSTVGTVPLTYDVKLSSKYYATAPQFTLGPDSTALAVEFRPKEPGTYPCTVTMVSPLDTRVLHIEGTGTAPNTFAALTFESYARRPLLQEIPIVNATDRDWVVRATFSGSSTYFEGPGEITVQKRPDPLNDRSSTVGYYPLR